jgi:hypothetical protein
MNASLHCMKYPSYVMTTSANVTFDNDIKITNHIHIMALQKIDCV